MERKRARLRPFLLRKRLDPGRARRSERLDRAQSRIRWVWRWRHGGRRRSEIGGGRRRGRHRRRRGRSAQGRGFDSIIRRVDRRGKRVARLVWPTLRQERLLHRQNIAADRVEDVFLALPIAVAAKHDQFIADGARLPDHLRPLPRQNRPDLARGKPRRRERRPLLRELLLLRRRGTRRLPHRRRRVPGKTERVRGGGRGGGKEPDAQQKRSNMSCRMSCRHSFLRIDRQ